MVNLLPSFDNMKEGNESSTKEALQEETRIELGLLENFDITREDLLGSVHDLSFLSSLYHSIVRIYSLLLTESAHRAFL